MNWTLLHHWFAQPLGLALLALTPLLTIAALIGLRARRQRLLKLGRLPAVLALSAQRGQWRMLRSLCLLFGLTLLALGVAGPQWGREAERVTSRGRDCVVLLDLSRSMLADDVPPDENRIARARQALVKLAESVQRRGGHRLGLVVFATRAEVVCPLTHDYSHFIAKVEEMDPAILPNELRPGFQRPGEPPPDDVSGTRLGAGIQAAVDAHDPRFAGFQDILLITDGDDPVADKDWVQPAYTAASKEMGIYVVGIGDIDRGGRIPTPDGYYLTKDRQPYWSKLNEAPLQEIAKISPGEYVPARTGPLRLDELFASKIESAPKRLVDDDAVTPYRQRYRWFYAAALLLLVAEMTLGRLAATRQGSAGISSAEPQPPARRPRSPAGSRLNNDDGAA